MAKSALEQALSQQLGSLNELSELLDNELSAIAGRSGEQLNDITPKKRDALLQIQTLDKHIAKLLSTDKTPTEAEHSLIAHARDLLLQCKQKNQVNAQAAHQAQLSVKQLKDILIGAPSSQTYTAKGGINRSENTLVRNLKA